MFLPFHLSSIRRGLGSARTLLPGLPELGNSQQTGQEVRHLLSAGAESLALPITLPRGKS